MAENVPEVEIEQGNDDGKGVSFGWEDSLTMSLMKVLKQFHMKFGYKQSYDWAIVNNYFLEHTGITLGKYVARNKVEHMKKLWKGWCGLRFNVTEAGWDKAMGMVTLPGECWDRFKKTKLKGYLNFRKKGVVLDLCELWDEAFGNTVATGKNVISPSMEPSLDLSFQFFNYFHE